MRLPDWLRVTRSRRTSENMLEVGIEVVHERLRELLEQYEQSAPMEGEYSRSLHAPRGIAMDVATEGQIGDFRAAIERDMFAAAMQESAARQAAAINAVLRGEFEITVEGEVRPTSPYAGTADEAPGVLLEDLLNDIDKELGR